MREIPRFIFASSNASKLKFVTRKMNFDYYGVRKYAGMGMNVKCLNSNINDLIKFMGTSRGGRQEKKCQVMMISSKQNRKEY